MKLNSFLSPNSLPNSISNIVLVVIFISLFPIVNAACSSISVRKEFRQFSDQERRDFLNAVRALNQGVRPTRFDRLVRIHQVARENAHYQPQFLPWHRYFLREYERALQSINPRVVLPYWNWGEDASNPTSSRIFSNEWFGGNGNCVNTGAFANWRVYYYGNNYYYPHCLRRNINLQDNVVDTVALQNIILTSDRYDTLRRALEGNPHSGIHVGIGGDMFTMASPNDPLFYMHHAFIDKLWADWQKRNPRLANQYEGRNKDGTYVTLNEVMQPFNVRVGSAMSTTSDGYCYVYNEYSGSRNVAAADAEAEFSAAEGTRNSTRLSNVKPKILREPKSTPEQWIIMNGGNVREVRAQENRLKGFIRQFNQNVTSNLPLNVAAKVDI
ncbi:uncharacterized protein VTP21DRAFT_6906 [Calcarisporiella thermophila]|uniref:uncharacterized protein n=1 Tax=Calcarisporiella thermophila TaxID=911321 RepID=UPI003741ECCF